MTSPRRTIARALLALALLVATAGAFALGLRAVRCLVSAQRCPCDLCMEAP